MTKYISWQINVSYCMVCAYVREDNPRVLASTLSPIHTHNHTIIALLHQHAHFPVKIVFISCLAFS